MRKLDLTGQRFGKLVVIERKPIVENGKVITGQWLCQCDCGKTTVVKTSNLTIGKTKSCGCIQYQNRHKGIGKTHGLSKTPLYHLWLKIKERCYQPSTAYDKTLYKDRNIKMCDEWLHDFKAFYDWALANGYKYEKGIGGRNKWTIDRIDNNKGYEPSNCRFVDMKVQCSNRRHKSKQGTMKPLTQIKLHYGYSRKEKLCQTN